MGDLSVYPVTGDVFTVRYLSHHPQDVMIHNDDQSPWSRKLACSRLAAWRADALRQSSALPDDASLGRELTRATAAERAAGCLNWPLWLLFLVFGADNWLVVLSVTVALLALAAFARGWLRWTAVTVQGNRMLDDGEGGTVVIRLADGEITTPD